MKVGDGIEVDRKTWTFRSDDVAAAFDEHVALSTPGYDDLQASIARLSTFFVRDGSTVVDYGCATGRTLAEVSAANVGRRVRYVGVDESEAMCARARERLRGVEGTEVRTANLLAVHPPSDASLVLAVYVLQFMGEGERERALRVVRERTEPGCALIVVEKTVPDDPALAVPFYEAHHDEKRAGYSEEQVAAKARSLRGVLRPLPARKFEESMARAGWSPQRFWQRLAFVGWVCT